MTVTAEKIQTPQGRRKSTNRWILIAILLFLVLFTAGWMTPAHSSFAASGENLPAVAGLSPTATRIATSTPTATINTTAASAQETTVKATGFFAIRLGPGVNFAGVRMVTFNEELSLLGRLSDDSWLYVKTADGQEGWIEATRVDLTGIDVDNHPIITPSPYPETTVAVTAGGVNLRSGPKTQFSKIRKLAYGESVTLLGRLSDNSWIYVKTVDGLEGWIETGSVDLGWINLNYHDYPVKTPPPTQTATPVVLTNVEGHWIDIDLSEQRLYAYDGTTLVASFLVSTGISRYPTEVGQYHIDSKYRYSDMHGDDYFLPDVPFTMYYYEDFSIHGTYWHHSFGQPMSHGCINMDIPDSEWVYNFSEVGTLVNIHR